MKKMLPIFTTGQIKDGIDTGDLMLDLSEYMKKKDGATKVELTELTAVVANKLDATPQHTHHLEDIKQLQNVLNGKYDKSEKYSYNVILNDTEKIPFLESPQVQMVEIVRDKDEHGYTFYVDEKSGDLMITLNNVLIGTYSIASGKWSFETDTSDVDSVLENHAEALNAVCNATLKNITDISTMNAKINEYIAKTDAILKNHYDALLLLCQKHGMVDTNTDDGANVSPL